MVGGWAKVAGRVDGEMAVILGSATLELNSEIEHQTARDTTIGPPKPLGIRGAVMADTVGAAQS